MACDSSDVRRDDRAPAPVKILIAGGFGVGKTTPMGMLTGIRPLPIEESVATDFGRNHDQRPRRTRRGMQGGAGPARQARRAY